MYLFEDNRASVQHMSPRSSFFGLLDSMMPWTVNSGWVLLNSAGGTLAEWVYKRGELDFFAKFVAEDFGYLVINSFILPLS